MTDAGNIDRDCLEQFVKNTNERLKKVFHDLDCFRSEVKEQMSEIKVRIKDNYDAIKKVETNSKQKHEHINEKLNKYPTT